MEKLDSAQQVRIFDLSARMVPTLHRWAARYPLIRRVRVWPLALSVAAAAPFSSVEALVAEARVSLWVFTLDDLFDEERVPERELMRRAERYRAIVRGEAIQPAGDSLANALREIRAELATYPLFEALGSVWADAMCGTIDGMTREYYWRLSCRRDEDFQLPSYEDYVANGLYSIGGPPHIWAAIITVADPSAARCVEHLSRMEKLSSTCIRLANDLQSYAKEIEEEKFNSVSIISHQLQAEGKPADKAIKAAELRVREIIAEGVEQLAELQAAGRSDTGHPEAAVADIARFVCDFYVNHDYHTFYTEGATLRGTPKAAVAAKA